MAAFNVLGLHPRVSLTTRRNGASRDARAGAPFLDVEPGVELIPGCRLHCRQVQLRTWAGIYQSAVTGDNENEGQPAALPTHGDQGEHVHHP